MPWFLVALFVGALVASLLLTPKPKLENARASTLDDLNFPRSTEGAPVPIGLGKFRARGPNTLWADDWEAVPIKKKVKTGLFSSKKVIVGYRYFIGLALGICLGPGCKLHKIWYGKDLLWEGEVSADGSAININLPELFGGTEKGGGFVGTLRFYSGSFTQGVNSYMEGVIGAGDATAYRGLCYIVFEHVEIGERNSLQDLSFEVSRYTNGLALSGGKEQIGEDLNAIELLYQLYTLDWGGLDVDPAIIDLASFVASANTVYDEGNGMSLFISSSNDGSDLSNEVLRQVDGLLYQNPSEGSIVLKLVRNDYDVGSLPVLDESNIVAVRNFTSKLWEDTKNRVRIKYTNREKKYEDGSAMEDDFSNILAQGRVRPTTQSYPGVTTGDLASAIAKRDLSQFSVPTLSASIEANREAQNLRPGDVFVWGWDEYGIEQVVMRIKNFDLGALTDGRIVFECNQDEFAIGQTLFAAPGPGGSNPGQPSTPAAAATNRFVIEAPYFISNAAGIALGDGAAILLVGATPPANSDEMDVYTSIDTVNYTASEQGLVYPPVGILQTAIGATANLSTGVLASLTITVDADELETFSASEVANGYGMIVIGNEILAYESFVDNMNGTITVSNVWRALLDTVASAHSVSDKVYFLTGDSVVDDPLSNTAAVRVKMLPRTFSTALDIGSAPYDALTLDRRAQRPLRPAYVRFDGGTAFAAPATVAGSKTVTWANRDRKSLTVRKIVDTTNVYESGQETVFRYRKNGGAWTTNTIANGIGTFTFDAGAILGDTVDYEIWATRDGLDSLNKWTFTAGP